ncbi:late competence development ComFB family protein [Ureibacillus thermophilus]|uniref:Competence protein ComFB n=1 Tax=Ureibacillus thermophilus TaxID=367743 RepID=A0A4P6UQ12_9BACL|nr:late competence development ComFB family protein [Ureibacillus thermophilus]QBK24607.1 competence protein ComFB [Ureibacillus thermophilus]
MTGQRLVNVMEELVSGLVRFFLRSPEYQIFCNCNECEMRIVAKALNNLPPHYVVSESEREKVFNELKSPKNIEIINKEIIRAIYEAGNRRNHVV